MKAKKITAALVTAGIVFNAFAVSSGAYLTAPTAEQKKSAITLTSGKTKTTEIKEYFKDENGVYKYVDDTAKWYKITVKKTGKVTLNVCSNDTYYGWYDIELFNSKDEPVKFTDTSVKLGDISRTSNGTRVLLDTTEDRRANATIKYNLKKGTYYFLVDASNVSEHYTKQEGLGHSFNLDVTLNGTSSKKAKASNDVEISDLCITLKKGTEIGLGAILTGTTSDKVKVSTLNGSMVSISETGTVTALDNGIAFVYVTLNDSKKFIVIKVVD